MTKGPLKCIGATIPVKIIIEIPLPIPLDVIWPPNHTSKSAPPTSVETQTDLSKKLASAGNTPNLCRISAASLADYFWYYIAPPKSKASKVAGYLKEKFADLKIPNQ